MVPARPQFASHFMGGCFSHELDACQAIEDAEWAADLPISIASLQRAWRKLYDGNLPMDPRLVIHRSTWCAAVEAGWTCGMPAESCYGPLLQTAYEGNTAMLDAILKHWSTPEWPLHIYGIVLLYAMRKGDYFHSKRTFESLASDLEPADEWAELLAHMAPDIVADIYTAISRPYREPRKKARIEALFAPHLASPPSYAEAGKSSITSSAGSPAKEALSELS